MNVAEAEKNFAKLVDKVYLEGVSVDLELALVGVCWVHRWPSGGG